LEGTPSQLSNDISETQIDHSKAFKGDDGKCKYKMENEEDGGFQGAGC